MSAFKAILFDYDDTLVDTYDARLKAAEVAAKGILDPNLDMDFVKKEWAGRPQKDIWLDLTQGSEERASELNERYANHYWNITTHDVTPFPGTREMLEAAKSAGIKLAIVTSKIKAMQGKNGTYGVVVELERLGLTELFEVVVGWPDVTESKPAPAPLLYALNRLGEEPSSALMVGDSHIDVRASKNAGVASAAALWGTLRKDLLMEARPDHLLDAPSDLRAIL